MFDGVPISRARATAIRTRKGGVSDADISVADRRSRSAPMLDARGTVLAIGDVVDVSGEIGQRTVIEHGRGRGFLIIGWSEDSVESYGTVAVREVTRV